MLVLSRHRDESIICTHPDGTRIVITLIELRGDKARIGLEAPREVTIDRMEIHLDKMADIAEGDPRGHHPGHGGRRHGRRPAAGTTRTTRTKISDQT